MSIVGSKKSICVCVLLPTRLIVGALQAITSAGSGAMAALDAERYLSERGLGDDPAAAAAPAHSEL